MNPARHPPAYPFFLASRPGERYCLYHPAAQPSRGALLYVHPFAEEMNRSRHMAAVQARAFAALGWAVLQLDLHGCGDSDGDFADARWEHWKTDLEVAREWLASQTGHPVGLWGARLGSLLALDHAASASVPVPFLLLWQPVLDGGAFLTRFLRLHLAASILAGDGSGAGTAALRRRLAAGEALDIAGYRLAPQLAAVLDRIHADALPPPCPTSWIDIASAGSDRVCVPAAWKQSGLAIRNRAVTGPAFWDGKADTDCTALVMASCELLPESGHE